ncbi:hypothetical protein PGTUg99_020723 [Puccinia graminis f. sp. tritici]|uniref:Uncharacterized protein n=1 Tax=Puccinia graminis f. sp. tritici TaxID=56615 RepID=A0A5B0QLD0_PUCGR|nr:hypothetical protein PGTUg99_020723 [Puccinia graminis f. sp. tritici]
MSGNIQNGAVQKDSARLTRNRSGSVLFCVVGLFVVGSFIVGSFVVGSFVVGLFVVGSLSSACSSSAHSKKTLSQDKATDRCLFSWTRLLSNTTHLLNTHSNPADLQHRSSFPFFHHSISLHIFLNSRVGITISNLTVLFKINLIKSRWFIKSVLVLVVDYYTVRAFHPQHSS